MSRLKLTVQSRSGFRCDRDLKLTRHAGRSGQTDRHRHIGVHRIELSAQRVADRTAGAKNFFIEFLAICSL